MNCQRSSMSLYHGISLVTSSRAYEHLATMCPALRTLIIQRGDMEAATRRPFHQSVSLETAAYYATILEYTGPDLGYEELDNAHFRSLLLQYFGDTHSRLHLLSLHSAIVQHRISLWLICRLMSDIFRNSGNRWMCRPSVALLTNLIDQWKSTKQDSRFANSSLCRIIYIMSLKLFSKMTSLTSKQCEPSPTATR